MKKANESFAFGWRVGKEDVTVNINGDEIFEDDDWRVRAHPSNFHDVADDPNFTPKR